MKEDQKINSIRQRIDDVDKQIQTLISERGSLAKEVASEKTKAGNPGDKPNFYRPEREAQILRRIIERNKGPLADEEIARLFREIMSVCLALEQSMQIAFFGQKGTFTQEAAFKHFGHSVTTCPMSTIDDVFREVQSGSVNFGVVPVENSTEGVINHTLDILMNSSLKICGEVELPIHHNILSKSKDVTKINKLYSHAQSFAQCRNWLDNNMPGVEQIAVGNNAEAASRAAEEKGTGAIAGKLAAEIYGLSILNSNIEDQLDNATRFLVVGGSESPRSGEDKTTILVSAHNKPGALWKLLDCFAKNQISMTRIESRPSRLSPWDYVFFIDIEGHLQDQAVAVALDTLKQEAAMFKVLGSYPKAVV
jgi:chorismate mutase/prephenate dehydratase